MRFLFFTCLFLFLLVTAVPSLLLVSALEKEPLIGTPYPGLTARDVERIREWARVNNPNRLRTGEVSSSMITQRDLNLGIRHILPVAHRQHTRITLYEDAAIIGYSFRLPTNPVGNYLNLSARIVEENGQAELERLTLGKRNVPEAVWRALLWVAERGIAERWPEYTEARDALEGIHLRQGQATLVYRWDWDLVRRIEERGREYFISPQDRVRAVAYYRVLSDVSHAVGPVAPLQILLQALFSEAASRSVGGNAAAENRILLLVLGTVLRQTDILRVIGGDDEGLGRRHRQVKWTLHRRHDLAVHFSISAAVAATSTEALADAVGVIKELYDADVGSGFSFVDLLADRAGVSLAQAATGTGAARIQSIMQSGAMSEVDFMPAINALPEAMMSMAFKVRYHDLDDQRYQVVKNEIDQRVGQLALYQP